MNKTPISILQEMMVKKMLVPNYELIHNGGGTHINTFTYQVSCDGLSATGSGRCKKDAKHEAAKAMLENIAARQALPQLPASPAQSPIHTPLPTQVPPAAKLPANEPFVNAIGALQELCSENNLNEPEYKIISDVGPPHARIFTIHCILSTFKEEGVATTKKQAKHEAAKKMLHRIMDVVGDPNAVGGTARLSTEYVTDIARIAEERYPELTKIPAPKRTNFGMKISEYHIRLANSLEENERQEIVENLQKLLVRAKADVKQIDPSADYLKLQSDFKSVLGLLNLDMDEILLSSKEGGDKLAGISVDSSPAMMEIAYGRDKDEALFKAMIKIIDTLLVMLA